MEDEMQDHRCPRSGGAKSSRASMAVVPTAMLVALMGLSQPAHATWSTNQVGNYRRDTFTMADDADPNASYGCNPTGNDCGRWRGNSLMTWSLYSPTTGPDDQLPL